MYNYLEMKYYIKCNFEPQFKMLNKDIYTNKFFIILSLTSKCDFSHFAYIY